MSVLYDKYVQQQRWTMVVVTFPFMHQEISVLVSAKETKLREIAADFEYREMEHAFNKCLTMKRDCMARVIERRQLTCPGSVCIQYWVFKLVN